MLASPPLVVIAHQMLDVALLVVALEDGHARLVLVFGVGLVLGIAPDRVDGDQDPDNQDGKQEEENLVRLEELDQ